MHQLVLCVIDTTCVHWCQLLRCEWACLCLCYFFKYNKSCVCVGGVGSGGWLNKRLNVSNKCKSADKPKYNCIALSYIPELLLKWVSENQIIDHFHIIVFSYHLHLFSIWGFILVLCQMSHKSHCAKNILLIHPLIKTSSATWLLQCLYRSINCMCFVYYLWRIYQQSFLKMYDV